MKRTLTLTLTLALALMLSLCAPALAAEFTDVPPGHTFHDAAAECSAKGIVSGYSDGRFKPGEPVTRAQFCVMLSRAFYPDAVQKNNIPLYTSQGWFVPNTQALFDNGVLTNTSFLGDFAAAEAMNQKISRYDMAQLMTNIMSAKGFAATEAQKFEAQYEIPDYSNVPSQYKDAVVNVYALGIITGYKDGSFNGSGNMTRGAGAAVVYRMMQYKPAETPTTPASPVTPKPETPSEPDPVPEGNKVITVSSAPTGNSNEIAWTVGDNNYPTGYLNNGDPITEENVIALLKVAEKQWTHGIKWDDHNGGYENNNVYSASSNTQSGRRIGYVANNSRACGGYANMISEYLFGKNNNPLRKLDDNSQIRPGDIIIHYNRYGTCSHVAISLGHSHMEGKFLCADGVTDGNNGSIVQWAWTNLQGAAIYPKGSFANAGGCEVWTRYPD